MIRSKNQAEYLPTVTTTPMSAPHLNAKSPFGDMAPKKISRGSVNSFRLQVEAAADQTYCGRFPSNLLLVRSLHGGLLINPSYTTD